VGTLYLVGMGLNPEDITRRAREVVSRCRAVFCETYTSLIPGLDESGLEDLWGCEICALDRGALEEGSVLMEALLRGDVALLIPGDPMISTTHISLRVQAAAHGYKSRIIHASSIISAAMGESCLTATRFGRMATISFHPSVQPYDVLAENKSRGLHTLFLLDVDGEAKRYMTIREALESLLSVEGEKRLGIMVDDTLAVGLARVSARDQVVRAGSVEELRKYDFGGPPHTLIIPGKLHFAESEALDGLLSGRGES